MRKQTTETGKPFSIRLTKDEKDRLREKADGTPLGIFIRERLLDDQTAPRATRRQYPVKDTEPLGKLLGLLGQSRLANNLNQIAKAVNQGALPVTKEVEADIHRACGDIAEMRLLLLKALGIKIIEEAKAALQVAETFNDAAGGQL